MSKQDIIREGIVVVANRWFGENGLASQTLSNDRSFEGDLLAYLHSQGVVIRVERECSHCNGTGFTDYIENGTSTVCSVCYGEGRFVATEPLIELDNPAFMNDKPARVRNYNLG